MDKFFIGPGIYWVNVQEAGIQLLCGSPMDVIKHLKRRGLVRPLEKKGILFETGPNALLLSDTAMQDGKFCNLSEFPILHMIYKQGLSLPGHPNHSEHKPLLIGSKEQVKAQKDYIFMGNMGLSSMEKLKNADLPQRDLDDLWSLKMHFNHGRIPNTNDILDSLVLGSNQKEIRNGLFIERIEDNLFELTYKNEHLKIDLNLKDGESYLSPFNLNYHKVKREYFSVIHSGEGNGWDSERPCMGSVLTYLGKFYLIDTGPNITDILTSLGICLNQIEGIFQTHAHDDHFAGLTSLMQSSHRIKYYAAKSVRLTVQKKMASLLGREEKIFSEIFDVHDLSIREWNNIHGLEVLPLISPHPLETTIFYFRTMSSQGYKTYGHLADIIMRSTLKSFTTKDPCLSKAFYEQIWQDYLMPADIKKIDTGLGFVHGRAEDFKKDPSKRILLSHKDSPLSPDEKEIGSNATFGQQDVLIPALDNFDVYYGREQLMDFFPDAPIEDIQLLMNNPLVNFSPGTIILKSDEIPQSVYLITSGFTEFINREQNICTPFTAGSLLGEIPALLKNPLKGTYRAACYIKALEIPATLYGWFIRKNNFYNDIKRLNERRSYIYRNPILGAQLSYTLQSQIARNMEEIEWKKGHIIEFSGKGTYLYIIKEGSVELQVDHSLISLSKGEPLGLEDFLAFLDRKEIRASKARALKKTELYAIPVNIIKESPHLQWNLLDIYENRIKQL